MDELETATTTVLSMRARPTASELLELYSRAYDAEFWHGIDVIEYLHDRLSAPETKVSASKEIFLDCFDAVFAYTKRKSAPGEWAHVRDLAERLAEQKWAADLISRRALEYLYRPGGPLAERTAASFERAAKRPRRA